MEQQDLNNTILINGNVSNDELPTARVNLTADKRAYMRNYMKTYMPAYKIENPEKVKIIEHRKYWRAKFKSVGLYIQNNDELDALSADDCINIHKILSAKIYMETKPKLYKYI